MSTRIITAFILATFVFIGNFFSFAETSIQMDYDGGVYKVPCRINGAKMRFVLDTGASSVCLSVEMAEYLLEYGYISEDDFTGIGYSTLADGSIVDHLELVVKDIEIGGLHVKDVQAIVIASQSAPLLMGQSALQKLGSYTINGNKLIINNTTQEENAKRKQLLETANDSFNKGLYALAISSYEQAEKILELDYVNLEHLAWCYKYERKFKECYDTCKKWLSLYECFNKRNFNESIYNLFWRCNYYYGYDEQALIYKQKQMMVKSENATKQSLGYDQAHLAQIFYELKRYDDAMRCLNKAITYAAEFNNSKSKLPIIKDNDLLGFAYWYMSKCYQKKQDRKNCKKYLEFAVKCGYSIAVKVSENKASREAFIIRGITPSN